MNMPSTTFRERFAESRDRVDREAFVNALQYVRDDGRRRAGGRESRSRSR